MKLIIVENYEELSKRAAQIISDAINENPRLVLGLATGGTPLGTYRELIEMYKRGGVSFKRSGPSTWMNIWA